MSIRVKVPWRMNLSFFFIFPLNFWGSSAVVGAAGVFLGVGFAAGTRSIARCTRTLLPSCVEENSIEPHSASRMERFASLTSAFTDISCERSPRGPPGARRDAPALEPSITRSCCSHWPR